MQLNDKNYKEYLKGITVVEVSGESCANCLTLMPILNELISKRENVELHHIEVGEDSMEFIQKYEILAVPTILVMLDEKVMARCRGYQPEEILEIWLDAKMEEISLIKNNS